MSPKRRISFSTRIAIIVSIFLLLMDGLLGGILMARSANNMKAIVQTKILEISQTAADFLNPEEIASLQPGDNVPGGLHYEQYKKAYDTLWIFKENSIDKNAGLAYIYTIAKTSDDRYVFSVDPDPEDPGAFLTEETIKTKALVAAFNGQPGFDDQSYVDRWGDLYSAYAPIQNRETGEVTGVVGVDVYANWYKNQIAQDAIMIGVVTGVTIILGVLATVIITRKMRKRIDELSLEMDELQGDIHHLISDVHDPSYIPNLKESDKEDSGINQLRKQIDETRLTIKNYIEYAHEQAYVDALTGLGNRNDYFALVEEINKKITEKIYVSFAILVFDINGLKLINDEHGHEQGDKAIIVAGEVLKELFGEDISFRIGGDELVVIYQNVYEDTLKEKINQLNELIDKHSETHQLPCKLTLSYGYSFFNETKDKRYEDVFNKADEKMYKQKTQFYASMKHNRRKQISGVKTAFSILMQML